MSKDKDSGADAAPAKKTHVQMRFAKEPIPSELMGELIELSKVILDDPVMRGYFELALKNNEMDDSHTGKLFQFHMQYASGKSELFRHNASCSSGLIYKFLRGDISSLDSDEARKYLSSIKYRIPVIIEE